MDDRPIGMFDSGFGGLTVAKALTDLLPSEDLVYVGDSGRYPYGPRSLDEVRGFAAQITRKLVETHDVKLVVVACNTATAAALEHAALRLRRPPGGRDRPRRSCAAVGDPERPGRCHRDGRGDWFGGLRAGRVGAAVA